MLNNLKTFSNYFNPLKNILMKTKILLFLTILSLASCNKDNKTKTNPVFQLPPETQTCTDTFV